MDQGVADRRWFFDARRLFARTDYVLDISEDVLAMGTTLEDMYLLQGLR